MVQFVQTPMESMKMQSQFMIEYRKLTARGMGRHENKRDLAISDFYDLTRNQLDSWGVKYHQLFLGKPAGDKYIDDKGINDVEFFRD